MKCSGQEISFVITLNQRQMIIRFCVFNDSSQSTRAKKANALGKLGNIVAETLRFPSMFPCLPTWGNIVAETKFASQEATMFLNKFRNIFVAVFSSVSSTRNIVS